jgi:hypothetical protein
VLGIFSGDKRRPVRRAEPYHFHVPTVYKYGSFDLLGPHGPVIGLYIDCLTFMYTETTVTLVFIVAGTYLFLQNTPYYKQHCREITQITAVEFNAIKVCVTY